MCGTDRGRSPAGLHQVAFRLSFFVLHFSHLGNALFKHEEQAARAVSAFKIMRRTILRLPPRASLSVPRQLPASPMFRSGLNVHSVPLFTYPASPSGPRNLILETEIGV
jgi:hypothetical protein